MLRIIRVKSCKDSHVFVVFMTSPSRVETFSQIWTQTVTQTVGKATRTRSEWCRGNVIEMSRRAKMKSHKPTDTTKTTRKKKICSSEDAKISQYRGEFAMHGATHKHKICSIKGCQKQAVQGQGGVCIAHGATLKRQRKM